MKLTIGAIALAAAFTAPELSQAQDIDWQQQSGTILKLLFNEHPWTEGLRPHIEEFEALTGIDVELTALAEDLYFDRMNLAVRSKKSVADVYFVPMDGAAYEQYQAGAMTSLTPYLDDVSKTAADYDLADIPASFRLGATFPPGDPSAELYSMPIAFEAYTLFYNKEIVDEYLDGVVPTTMDDLVAAAQMITEESGGKIFGATMRGQRSASLVDTLTGVVLNDWGGAEATLPQNIWFDGDWDKPRFNDPKIASGLAHYAGLLKAGPPNILSFNWSDASRFFSQGRAAFFIDASLFGPGFEDPASSKIAGNVGYAPLPAANGNVGHHGHWLWGLSVPANSENADAAWLFIQWATSKEMDVAIGKSTGGAPRLSTWDNADYTSSLDAGYVTALQTAMLNTNPTVVFTEGWGEVVIQIVDTIHEIYAGKDPQEAVESLQVRAVEVLQ
jgi:multiple sugar transport system substrate-binding protein